MKKNTNTGSVKIIPLGGFDKIGMNITAFEYEDSIIVVDCGISFPDEEMLGIDKVIPDVTYLIENKAKVKGFVITHGHEDHIGALPYILPQINIPIYATQLTMGLIEHKLEEAHLMKNTRRKVVKLWDHSGLNLSKRITALPMPAHWQSIHPQVSLCIRVTLRSTIHRYLEMPLTCSVWVPWVKKACWH